MEIVFQPKILTIKENIFSSECRQTLVIKNEPMIFSGDLRFSWENGGPLTKKALTTLLSDKKFWEYEITDDIQVVIDSRVTMTTIGQYPSIPGWHCDDVPRKNQQSQPDFSLCSDDVAHFMVLFSDKPEGVSGTEFVTSTHSINIDSNKVWNSLDKEIQQLADKKVRFLNDGELVYFNQLAIHRASPAKSYGWRFFLRVSYTYRKPVNEIRNQVQIYTPVENGW
jgi:hypothetical protein